MSKLPFIKIMCVIAGVLVSTLAWAYFSRSNGTDLPKNRAAVYGMAVHVLAGTYATGSREPGCYPPQNTILKSFYILPTEVPEAWMATFKGVQFDGQNAAMPAVNISYHDAVAFCEWFSERYGVRARLPTRPEWETAARCGKDGIPYSWGWSIPADQDGRKRALSAVNIGNHNAWGLYHMSGNVAEWCAAGNDDSYAPVMGGSWAERDSAFLRISHKLTLAKNYQDGDVGFRIAIDPPEQETVASMSPVGE